LKLEEKMSVVQETEVKWTPDQMVEVLLREPDDFLKVRETLTRIGVASRKEKKIYQSCHILHKQGRYFLVHFKELFALDGKHANLTLNDVQRRNRIAQLLADWGLIEIVDVSKIQDIAPLNQIKVLAYKDKQDWILETKYNIGAKKKKVEVTE
jgi:2-polyprenyl-6-methoxyphenol hydroxylase-like FAD-dependent oxidoreductase